MNTVAAFLPALLFLTLLASPSAFGQEPTSGAAAPGMDDPVAYAESAGIPEIAAEATIVDAEGNVLREGTNEWTCMAMPQSPACMDPQWMEMMSALMNGDEEFEATQGQISYMLQGDGGTSNIDPFATEPTPDNQWVVTGPHLMLIYPDPAALDGLPTDPSGGGPYVMWPNTPFTHVMIPVEGGAVRMPRRGN